MFGFFDGPLFLLSPVCFRQASMGTGHPYQWVCPTLRFLQAHCQRQSSPPANFSFALKVPGFLLRTSHILAERLWQLDLDSAWNSSSLLSEFSARDVLGVRQVLLCLSMPCCQRTLLKVVSSCRQLALSWKGVMFHSCSLLHPAVTHPVTSIQTGACF